MLPHLSLLLNIDSLPVSAMMHILAFLLVYLTSYFDLPQVFGLLTNVGPLDKRLNEKATTTNV